MSLLQRFKKLPYVFQYLYDKVTTSIALLPSLMALGFVLLTSFMIYLERSGLTPWMDKHLPSFVLIKSWDVAEAILTTLIGALISLMVFSFSMVMVLLNNAASNYSPRILPSLIADRFHQFVLGTYLGTIIYCILFVINMTPSQPDIPLPGFSVLFGIFMGISCLMLFVLFIHSISESVQVGKILERINVETNFNMDNGIGAFLTDESPPTNSTDWPTYNADRSGYLRSVNIDDLYYLCSTEEIKLRMLVPESRFILEGNALFSTDKKIDKEIVDKILGKFVLSTNGLAKDDYVVGFKFITEIAVKAMSPGINDPGTALSAIDYLTILFIKKMELPQHGAVRKKDKYGRKLPTRLWLNIVTFDELLAFVLAPLRQYSRHDLMVILKMLEMMSFLYSQNHPNDAFREIIRREIMIIKEDAEKHLTNTADYKRVLLMIDEILEQ